MKNTLRFFIRGLPKLFFLCSIWAEEVVVVQFLGPFAVVKKQVQKNLLGAYLLFMEFHYSDLFLRNV